MINKPRNVVLLSLVAALCFWVLDATVDYLAHYDEPFLTILLFNKREVSFRLLASLCFLVTGMIMSRSFARQKRTEAALLNEIDERKRIEERLHVLSLRDELTGLHNRRGFFTLADQQFKLANRSHKRIFMFYADLDNLKTINDTYGHQEGDAALMEMAAVLNETFRESDIIARIGGDEFVAIPVGTEGDTIEVITSRFNRNLEIHNAEKDRICSIDASFGIVSYNPLSPRPIDELLAEGDRLMYEQKKGKQSA